MKCASLVLAKRRSREKDLVLWRCSEISWRREDPVLNIFPTVHPGGGAWVDV